MDRWVSRQDFKVNIKKIRKTGLKEGNPKIDIRGREGEGRKGRRRSEGRK